jgi:hypothetical protein
MESAYDRRPQHTDDPRWYRDLHPPIPAPQATMKTRRKKGSGGRRPGAGRKLTPGWVKVGTMLEVQTLKLLQDYSTKTGQPQSHLINDLIKAYFASNPI